MIILNLIAPRNNIEYANNKIVYFVLLQKEDCGNHNTVEKRVLLCLDVPYSIYYPPYLMRILPKPVKKSF
jgi:hypothetical protein